MAGDRRDPFAFDFDDEDPFGFGNFSAFDDDSEPVFDFSVDDADEDGRHRGRDVRSTLEGYASWEEFGREGNAAACVFVPAVPGSLAGGLVPKACDVYPSLHQPFTPMSRALDENGFCFAVYTAYHGFADPQFLPALMYSPRLTPEELSAAARDPESGRITDAGATLALEVLDLIGHRQPEFRQVRKELEAASRPGFRVIGPDFFQRIEGYGKTLRPSYLSLVVDNDRG